MTMLSSIGRATAHIVELDYSTSSSLAPIGPEQGVTFGGYELGIRTLVSYFYIIWVRRLEAEGDRLLTDYS